ncbi:MAG: recombinase family protein [Gemmatimonadetes bacterium]|nr:recombinase family protein [Gemmatimonadota bacterium]MBT5587987.1 recombinase family protein [Gemmatimonadota bacterium]MBT7456492.1 recombinase family protein [Gemmatimonadota bacterium]
MTTQTTKTTSKLSVLGYVRISTSSQIENTSIALQKRTIRQYVKSRGWNLVDIYEDVSSGSNTNRPGFEEMAKRLESNGFSAVVVTKLDRFSRSILDSATFIKGLLAKDKALISISENVDTGSIQGRMFCNLLMVIAENERENIQMRMSNGREELLRQNKLPSSYVYGYTRDKSGDLSVVADEAKVIQEMFHLYLDLESLGAVSRVFKERGYRTRQDKSFSRQTIQNLLRQPLYCGKPMKWRDETFKTNAEKLVSAQCWNKVARLMDSRSRKIPSPV